MKVKRYFRHFKGGRYELLTIGLDSEQPEKKLVVYKALYGDRLVWIRPYEMFFENVFVNGSWVKRFEEISEYEAFK